MCPGQETENSINGDVLTAEVEDLETSNTSWCESPCDPIHLFAYLYHHLKEMLLVFFVGLISLYSLSGEKSITLLLVLKPPLGIHQSCHY